MTHDQLIKLKDGDIIRNRDGNAYLVLRNTGHCVIASRTLDIFNGAEWEHVYTTTPVKEQAPQISLVHMVTELQALGWTFNEDTNEWRSPSGDIVTQILRNAWENRNHSVRRAAALATEIPYPKTKRYL